ncbi:hypothetical protein NE237_019477 [Protea cynaroides]|uniref:Uncharacterized protein n=1 Tax=Protea cynaroides TaxID=273540 RepID=A0A9Q0GMN2_9MAGN|nr:hypothetical protein NE237_019477 [Protea cynaroides]
MKSASEQSTTITDLLAKIEALHSYIRKLVSKPFGSVTALTTEVEKLHSQLLALDQLESYQSWEVYELRSRAKAIEKATDEYYADFLVAEDLAEGPLRRIGELFQFHYREIDLRLNAWYRMKLY